jgi:hypothetical protein
MYMTKVQRGDLSRKWALPDRIFFACGACHILAYAAIQTFPERDFKAIWIKPPPGHTGNHVVAVSGHVAFDYHGYSDWNTLLDHMSRKAARWWPGWQAELIALPPEVLISEAKSRTFDGLWLREPGQFLHDALPRAYRFVDRFAQSRGFLHRTA